MGVQSTEEGGVARKRAAVDNSVVIVGSRCGDRGVAEQSARLSTGVGKLMGGRGGTPIARRTSVVRDRGEVSADDRQTGEALRGASGGPVAYRARSQ